jgi:hypothetical protein
LSPTRVRGDSLAFNRAARTSLHSLSRSRHSVRFVDGRVRRHHRLVNCADITTPSAVPTPLLDEEGKS